MSGWATIEMEGNGNQARARREGGWEAYWRGTGETAAWTAGGASHPSLLAFWERFFASVADSPPGLRVLDLATGNGALVALALERLAPLRPRLSCVDRSEAAVENIRRRFPDVTGIVSDLRDLPRDGGDFDVVTSQFGVEYAGPGVAGGAGRLLAKGGRLALVMHLRGGLIERECRASLDAVRCIRESGFIPLAREMFRAGFAALQGADRAPYDEGAARMAPAAQTIERLVLEQGEQVAGGTPAQLYADVARIHGRLPAYDAGEVLAWLDRMERELDEYGERMSAMVEAALDEAAFNQVCAGLGDAGCTVEQHAALTVPGEAWPLAWTVVARRNDDEDRT